MAGSGDDLPAGAGDRRRLLASDADRDQVAAVLKAAFVQGRLTKAEFDHRVGLVFASRTYADLDVLTVDIPAEPSRAQPPAPVPEPDDKKKLIRRGTAVGAGVGLLTPLVAVLASGGPPAVGVGFGVLLSVVLSVLIPGFLTLLSWIFDSGSGRRPAQRPPSSAHGAAYQPLAPGDVASAPARSPAQLSPPEPPPTAEAGRRRSRPRLPGSLAGPGLRLGPRATAL